MRICDACGKQIAFPKWDVSIRGEDLYDRETYEFCSKKCLEKGMQDIGKSYGMAEIEAKEKKRNTKWLLITAGITIVNVTCLIFQILQWL